MDDERYADVPPVTLAYIAGLTDGEGTITIRRGNRGKGVRSEEYSSFISVAQKDRAILDWIKEVFACGSVVQHRFKETHDRFRSQTPVMHHWACTYANANRIITALRPYLRIKHRQADLALRLHALKASWTQRTMPGVRGRVPTPEYIMEECRALCIEVQTLNGRGSVVVGVRNPNAVNAGIHGAMLICGACGIEFESETYFTATELTERVHYCRACRRSGVAQKHATDRGHQKEKERRHAAMAAAGRESPAAPDGPPERRRIYKLGQPVESGVYIA
jgi:hypothetical protein